MSSPEIFRSIGGGGGGGGVGARAAAGGPPASGGAAPPAPAPPRARAPPPPPAPAGPPPGGGSPTPARTHGLCVVPSPLTQPIPVCPWGAAAWPCAPTTAVVAQTRATPPSTASFIVVLLLPL